MPNFEKLEQIVIRARELVSLPDNDFTWSSWIDGPAALEELYQLLVRLRNRDLGAIATLGVIFAPTGPMQELAISSGWSSEFDQLAADFDSAASENPCVCISDHSEPLNQVQFIGTDSAFAEVSLKQCPLCDQLWLRWFYEEEATTGSGRWLECPITQAERQNLSAPHALDFINSKPWHYCGGSYFGGQVRRVAGPANA